MSDPVVCCDNGIAVHRERSAGAFSHPAENLRSTVDTLRDFLAKIEGELCRSGVIDEHHETLCFIASEALVLVTKEVRRREYSEETLRFVLTRRADKPIGRIYVAVSPDRRLIKIGHTRQSCVEKRISQLRAVGDGPWALWNSVPGTREQESALHRTLKRWLFDRHEYYLRSPSLELHLREYADGYLELPISPPV